MLSTNQKMNLMMMNKPFLFLETFVMIISVYHEIRFDAHSWG